MYFPRSATPLHHPTPLLNVVDGTLGMENYGFGFLYMRGLVEALYLKIFFAKASFISKPMMICGPDLGCSPTCYSQTLYIQRRGSPLMITRCEKYKEYKQIYGLGVRAASSSLHKGFQARGSQRIA